MNARRLVAAALAAAAAVLGCNAILDINAPNIVGDGDGSADGNLPVDAGLNLITDPSFVNGCAQWAPGTTTFTAVDAGHTDGHACLACSSKAEFYQISRVMLSKARVTKVGDSFYAEAWVRKAPDRDAAPDMALEIEIDIGGPENTVEQKRIGSAGSLSETWQLMSGTFKVAAAGAGEADMVTMDISSRTGAPDGTDRCFVVDDVLFRPGSK